MLSGKLHNRGKKFASALLTDSQCLAGSIQGYVAG